MTWGHVLTVGPISRLGFVERVMVRTVQKHIFCLFTTQVEIRYISSNLVFFFFHYPGCKINDSLAKPQREYLTQSSMSYTVTGRHLRFLISSLMFGGKQRTNNTHAQKELPALVSVFVTL